MRLVISFAFGHERLASDIDRRQQSYAQSSCRTCAAALLQANLLPPEARISSRDSPVAVVSIWTDPMRRQKAVSSQLNIYALNFFAAEVSVAATWLLVIVARFRSPIFQSLVVACEFASFFMLKSGDAQLSAFMRTIGLAQATSEQEVRVRESDDVDDLVCSFSLAHNLDVTQARAGRTYSKHACRSRSYPILSAIPVTKAFIRNCDDVGWKIAMTWMENC
eukprot:779507-Pleurochrysis_carterae.AAC.2